MLVAVPAWGQAPAVPGPAPQVHTRAIVRALPSAAEPNLIRLKLIPRGQLPFTTLTFAVRDAALWQGLAVGDEVGFVAERRQGINTVVRLRKVVSCARFQDCAEILE
jgi:Cu/Ag efflux protein CusF